MIRRTFSCAAALALLIAPTALAAAGVAQQCDLAAARAAESSGVPIDLLLAITRVETSPDGEQSAPWPWTINANGVGQWYRSKDEAVQAAATHLADGTASFDVGCFQLNYRWHGENFADLSAMFDPATNADYAAAYLSDLFQEFGDWSQAVSAYHSRTADKADAYLDKVKSVLNAVDLPSDPAPPAPRQNDFPLLQTGGGQGSAGSIVPLTAARGRLIGGKS